MKSVAIVGAGTMGGGIAMACANAGLEVVTHRHRAGAARRRASRRIRTNYETSVKRGRMTADDVSERLGRIRTQVGDGGVGRRRSGDRGGVREHGA